MTPAPRGVRITTEQIDEVTAVLDRLRNDLSTVYELDRRLRAVERPDGYRASVRLMEGAASATDTDGEPLPPHSDPTGQTAAAVVDGLPIDSVRAEVRTMNDAFGVILSEARRADGARSRATLPDQRAGIAPDGCRVHEGYGLGWEPVHASGRCRWCYDFWLAEEQDPPQCLLERRARGQRISQAEVAMALVNQRSARARKRKRRAS